MSVYDYQDSKYSSHSTLLDLAKTSRVTSGKCLDVGCASGFLSFKLAQTGLRVKGVDPNLPTELLGVAHNPIFEQTTLLQLSDQRFGLIVAGDVIEHLEDTTLNMYKLGELLEDDGELLISIPNAVNIYVRLHILSGRFEYKDRGPLDKTHLRFFTLKTFEQLLKNSGFISQAIRYTPLPAYLFLGRRAKHFNSIIMIILNLLAQLLPNLFAYQLVYRVTKYFPKVS